MTLLALVSGLVWELPQNILGGILSLSRKRGSEVFPYSGATVIRKPDGLPYLWGVSLGTFINVGGNASGRQISSIVAHEFGHSLQSRILGPFYLLVVGLPSLIGCRMPWHDHNREWYEVWADRLSYKYHKKHGPKEVITFWNHSQNPLSYRLDWFFLPTALYYAALIALLLTLVL